MSVWWYVLGALALVWAIGFTVWAWLRRRRLRLLRALRKRLGRDRPRFPVVLVHGLFGFDSIARVEYFRGIRSHLEKEGVVVHPVRLPPAASIDARARALADSVRAIGTRVNIIAHSMGGLDARYAISQLGLRDAVAGLVTVGTPHRGTPVAAIGAGAVKHMGLRAIAKRLGTELDALEDLTCANLEEFNELVSDELDVFYGSVVTKAKLTSMNPIFLATYTLIKEPNDGLVPVESQRWGEVLIEADGDHWAQIGWSSEIDAPGMYLEIARELAWRGC